MIDANNNPRGLSEHLAWMRLRNLRDSTIYHRRRAIVRLATALGREPLDATADALINWRASLRQSVGAVHNEITHAHAFYGWALDADLIATDPTRRLIRPRLPRRLPRPISEVDLLLAVQQAPARIRPWLVLAAWEGLRAREIAYQRRDDVHDGDDPPYLHVTAEAAKGGRERIVPLSPLALDELRRHGMPASGWLFRRHDGQPGPNTPGLVSLLCNRYLHEIGVQGTLHSLRHRFGTQVHEISRDLRVTQEVLGHASPESTAGYVAFSQRRAVEAVAKLGDSYAIQTFR